MMLAQQASEIGTWVLVAVLVINGLGGVGGLIAIFATRREVDAIDKRLAGIEEIQRDDTKALHEKINGVDRRVAEVGTKTDVQTRQLINIETKLDRAIERRQA